MQDIVLSPEQASILASAPGLVAIRRPDGRVLAWISPAADGGAKRVSPFTPEEIAAAEKEADGPGPWRTTAEVLARLRSLDQPRS